MVETTNYIIIRGELLHMFDDLDIDVHQITSVSTSLHIQYEPGFLSS